MNQTPPPDNRSRIIELALELAQTRGFNGFSYRDLAETIGIKTASIHYYFPTKEDLGRALMRHYSAQLGQLLAGIRASGTPAAEQYRSFVAIFDATAKTDGRICLGGMLASDMATLPEALREDVRAFFKQAEGWVAELLSDGRSSGAFTFQGQPEQLAALMVAALEGGLITARLFSAQSRPAEIGAQLEQLFLRA